MERRYIWQVVAVLLVTISGVLGYMSGKTPSAPAPKNATNETSPVTKSLSDTPPELVLFADGTPVYGEEGSYCWTSRTQSQCVDRIGPAALVSDTPATTVARNTSYEIRAPDAPSPDSVHYTVHQQNNSIISTGDTSRFELPEIPPGTYIVAGGANWERGDVSYAFKIQITD